MNQQQCSFDCFWYISVGILFFLVIIYYVQLLDGSAINWLNIYLQVGTITIFVVNLMITLDNYKYQIDDRNKSTYSKYINIYQTKINDIDKMFMTNPMLNRLYCQLYSTDPYINKISKKCSNIKETQDIIRNEHQACSIIYQTMASIFMTCISCNNYNAKCEGMIEWYKTFKKWMQSSILKNHWIVFRNEHHPKFVSFIDSIIKDS